MAELFRYIQHSFVVPSAIPAIDVGRQSDLQNSLRDATSRDQPPDRVRSIAHAFIAKHFRSPVDDPFHIGQQLRSVSERLAPPFHGTDAISQLISTTFSSSAGDLVGSDPFQADKALLDDILVCVKITTGFDRVNGHELVAMRQTVAFIEDFAAGKVPDDTAEAVQAMLRRPIRIPSEFVNPVTVTPTSPPTLPSSESPDDTSALQRQALVAEQQHLKHAYETIMGLPSDQFELKQMSSKADRKAARNVAGRSGKDMPGDGGCGYDGKATSGAPSFLAIPDATIERLGGDVRKTLEKANIDIAGAPVSHVISAIKREWQEVSRQLAPYQAPAPTKVFRVGAHLFAIQNSAANTVAAAGEVL